MLSVSILSYPVTPHNNRISWPLAFVFFICYTRENAFAFSQKECLARPDGRLAFRVVTRNRYSFGLCVSLWYNRENSASFLNKNAVAARQLPVLAHQRIFAVSAYLWVYMRKRFAFSQKESLAEQKVSSAFQASA